MTKKTIVSDELVKLIQDQISNSAELDGDCRDCRVASVYWHEPDESGSNWDMNSFQGPATCGNFILAVVAKFKTIYNLKD